MDADLPGEEPEAPEAKKSSARILQLELQEAVVALEMPFGRLALSGLSAGLDIGFSLLLAATVITMAGKELPHAVVGLLAANMHSFGFILVVIGRSELFTEQTSLAILSLLRGQTSVRAVARLWGVVYITNQVGAVGFALLLCAIGPTLGVIRPEVLRNIGHDLVNHEAWVIFVSGVLAGWLMGLLSWLVAAGRDTISQIVIVWMITTAIALAHLHHSVLGSVEVLAAVFVGTDVGWPEFGHFLLWTTLGNAVGGPLFVALLKYGLVQPHNHERKS